MLFCTFLCPFLHDYDVKTFSLPSRRWILKSLIWTNNERVTLLLLLDLKGLCQLERIRVEVMNYFTYASKFKIQLFVTVLTRDFLLSRPRFLNLRRLYRGNWVWIGDILIEFTERFLSGLPQFRLFVKKRSFKTISLVVRSKNACHS